MRDPFSWSIPLGSLFGITVRINILYPIVAIGLVGHAYYLASSSPNSYASGIWIDVAMMMGLALILVLLHELGHCFAARWLNGSADEILIWPLGGLAQVDVPQTPKAHFLVAAAGPATNLLICFLLAGVFIYQDVRPTWNPLDVPWRINDDGFIRLYLWNGEPFETKLLGWIVLARTFWLSWVLFLFNAALPGFPLDMGRMLQATLWRFVGYRQATHVAVIVGFVTMLVLGITSIVVKDLLLFALAGFIYVSCRQQYIILETGGEESLFGYDFSQGYTSLERDQPIAPPRPRQPNWFQRWQQRRTKLKMQRDQEKREAEERRMDELLERVHNNGLSALTEEERRFLKRVSDRYRNRH
ncbi:MAG: site-2 protease family protein [Gemmataceae bacterium]